MGDWQAFLVTQGGAASADGIDSFGETFEDYPMLTRETVLVDLGNQGLLGVEGPDGGKFLQGQTTCDLNALTATSSLRGAFCNPKGRMIADFRALAETSDHILLIMHRELVPTTLQAVSKYAAFFKTHLIDRSADYRQLGIAGPEAESLLAKHFSELPAACEQVGRCDDTLVVRLADDRFLLLVSAPAAADRWQQLAAAARPVGLPFWQLLRIRAGEGQVFPQTNAEFIPQMLNFQATGAISFKKGCYTGQEIVARMQYLGKLKRHMYRLILADTRVPLPGTEVFLPGSSQSVGTLVYAAPADSSRCEALVVLRDDVSQAPELQFGERPVAVQLATLPYRLGHQA